MCLSAVVRKGKRSASIFFTDIELRIKWSWGHFHCFNIESIHGVSLWKFWGSNKEDVDQQELKTYAVPYYIYGKLLKNWPHNLWNVLTTFPPFKELAKL